MYLQLCIPYLDFYSLSNRYTGRRRTGVDIFRMEREISISPFTLHFCHYKCCLYRSLVKKVGRHWLVQSIGRNESNVDSNDINWRARVGTKISHAMRDLNRTMFSRYRFVRLTFIILSGRRSRIQVACRLKRKRNSRRINYFPRHFCPSANRHCYHGR